MKRRVFLWLYLIATAAGAQDSGGLYVAGGNFDFTQAVERALAQHPTPSKFFVLATGDSVRGLSVVRHPSWSKSAIAAPRGGGLLGVWRDIEREAFSLNELVSGVVAVRGWPPPGSNELPRGRTITAARTRPRCRAQSSCCGDCVRPVR